MALLVYPICSTILRLYDTATLNHYQNEHLMTWLFSLPFNQTGKGMEIEWEICWIQRNVVFDTYDDIFCIYGNDL